MVKQLPETSESEKAKAAESEAAIPGVVDEVTLKPALPKLSTTSAEQEFLISAASKKFLYCSGLRDTSPPNRLKPKPISAEIESVFFILWQNNAFNEALSLIVNLNYNERPSTAVLTALFKFLVDKSVRATSNFSYDSMDNNIYESIYTTCYAYILNLLLGHPPSDSASIKFYSQVFKNLELAPKM